MAELVFSTFVLQLVHDRSSLTKGSCPTDNDVRIGLNKLVSLFGMLAIAYLISSTCCAFEIAVDEGEEEREECPIDLNHYVDLMLANGDKIVKMDSVGRRRLFERLQKDMIKEFAGE